MALRSFTDTPVPSPPPSASHNHVPRNAADNGNSGVSDAAVLRFINDRRLTIYPPSFANPHSPRKLNTESPQLQFHQAWRLWIYPTLRERSPPESAGH